MELNEALEQLRSLISDYEDERGDGTRLTRNELTAYADAMRDAFRSLDDGA